MSPTNELPAKHKFVLNPYPYERLSRCPYCEAKTGQRKRPLLIHVDPGGLIALNYTCRYCQKCDLLIAHKHEIEHHLFVTFSQIDPQMIGNPYLIMGTVEKKVWRKGLTEPRTPRELIERLSKFEACHGELRHRQGGWYPAGKERPIVNPPPSKEWIKAGEGEWVA